MSAGMAVPDILFLAPDIGFAAADSAGPAVALPSMSDVGDAGEVVAEQLVELAGAALIGLGALSGALLATRAALAGTQLLAEAAVRAAEAQRQRVEDRERARCVEELWRDAVFAVARANARLDTLRARTAAEGGGPEGPGDGGPAGPGQPPLPPALDPCGMRLAEVYAWLGQADRAARAAEAALARRALRATPPGLRAATEHGGTPGALGQRAEEAARRAEALRARRERALAAYAAADTEAAAARALPAYRAPLPDAEFLTADQATALGAELLAGLDLNVSPEESARVEAAVAHAVELAPSRPVAAARHLAEARDLAFTANWRAADQRETAEWAAQQLRLLREPLPPLPDGHPSPPPVPAAELALLEAVVERGAAVTARQRAEIAGRVAERETALRRLYVTQLLRRSLARQGRHHERDGEEGELAATTVTQVRPGIHHIEWAPPDWGDEHWLRLVVDRAGTLRTLTMHRVREHHEDTEAARALDRARCREAGALLAALADAAEAAGLPLEVSFHEEHPVAGIRHPGPDGRPATTGRQDPRPGERDRARGERDRARGERAPRYRSRDEGTERR
ncbi:hypothetical protein FH609_023655 [Streptomyces sp. 3MP-14]|uniref:Uncharacterized protein n=1 Tax=Streptomyces mimosae TaxID=2586635 RepID=A0A5N6AEG0_9ACTN|nr:MULTISPECIES: hypothetical protein [Streptomyces]KAB8166356.1 hypothetical protein FH607_011015 [Streptomyces mimosae]KAB8174149.1 hypothetical protein FH609_023655 [Streptomyces sp. 3MP-14]